MSKKFDRGNEKPSDAHCFHSTDFFIPRTRKLLFLYFGTLYLQAGKSSGVMGKSTDAKITGHYPALLYRTFRCPEADNQNRLSTKAY